MKYITATLSCDVMDSLRGLGHIQDYTDDGYVLHEVAGWIPVSDILEYLLTGEEAYCETGEETSPEKPPPI